MQGVRLGQKYYPVGGDSGWDRKIRGTCNGKLDPFLYTDFTEEKYGGGAKI